MNDHSPLCNDQRLLSMLQDELSAAEADKLLDHVETCDQCQRRVDELAATTDEWSKVSTNLADVGEVPGGWSLRSNFSEPPAAWTESMARQLGPSLYSLGESVDRTRILRSILRPSADRAPHFKAWHVTTKDGGKHYGIRVETLDDGSLSLTGIDGKVTQLAADDIAEYSTSNRSLMPDGFEKMMTVSEMLDLVAYLESLGGGPSLD